MQTLKNVVLGYLKTETRFRERKNKNKGIANLLLRRYPDLRGIKKDVLVEALHDYGSMDRAWRQLLSQEPDKSAGSVAQQPLTGAGAGPSACRGRRASARLRC